MEIFETEFLDVFHGACSSDKLCLSIPHKVYGELGFHSFFELLLTESSNVFCARHPPLIDTRGHSVPVLVYTYGLAYIDRFS